MQSKNEKVEDYWGELEPRSCWAAVSGTLQMHFQSGPGGGSEVSWLLTLATGWKFGFVFCLSYFSSFSLLLLFLLLFLVVLALSSAERKQRRGLDKVLAWWVCPEAWAHP